MKSTLTAIALALTALTSAAQGFPSKNVTIVVPTAAGGGNDLMARTIAQKLAPMLGQSVIVENKAGANGAIASEFVARAAPDGHTLMLGYIATHAMNPALQKLRYDPVTDFEPVAMVGYSGTLMVANAAVGVKDVRDLVAQLKAKPERYVYATAGNGTAPHFAGELFKLNAGVEMIGVPYKGSSPAINDTLGGQTQFMFPSLFSALPHVKGGKLKALAIAGPKRSPLLPDVPTIAESGLPGFEAVTWFGFEVPKGTPPAIIERLNKEIGKALAAPEVKDKLAVQGLYVEGGTPEQFGSYMRAEFEKWGRLVKETGMSLRE